MNNSIPKYAPMPGEKLAPLPDWPPYVVSDQGYVIRIVDAYGKKLFLRLKNYLTPYGYHAVSLRYEGKRQRFQVHRLVMAAHCKEPCRGRIVHHINHIRNDNRIENLVYVSYKENTRAAMEAGRLSDGMDHYCAKFSDEFIDEVVTLWREGKYSQSQIGKMYGISRSYLSELAGGKKRKTRLKKAA